MLDRAAIDAQPVLERAGLGWRWTKAGEDVVITVDRIVERRDEITGEVLVTTTTGGYVLRRRVNLMGSQSLSNLARDLDEASGKAGVPWKRWLESACGSVIQAYRQGSPVEVYEGELPRPAGVSWLCQDLVMADVVNVWIAAGSSGKSTLAAILAVAVGLGKPFLGRSVAHGVVLYLDWESSEEDFREKLHDAAAGYGSRVVPKILRIRMRGPLKNQIHEIAEIITRYHVILVIVDAVAAAGGPMGDGNYEAVALDVEAAVNMLPPVTILLLDHVTGDDVKTGNVPLKARGSVRKTEFARNQWTLTLDRDQMDAERHVVAWTHTKVNRVRYLPAFASEIEHGDGWLRAKTVETEEAKVLVERMSVIQRIREYVRRNGPATIQELALEIYGKDDNTSCANISTPIRRDKGATVVRIDGNGQVRYGAVGWTTSAPSRPPLRVVKPGEERQDTVQDTRPPDGDGELPF